MTEKRKETKITHRPTFHRQHPYILHRILRSLTSMRVCTHTSAHPLFCGRFYLPIPRCVFRMTSAPNCVVERPSLIKLPPIVGHFVFSQYFLWVPLRLT